MPRLAAFFALALALAACNGNGAAAPEEAGEPVALAYGYQAGDVLAYDVDLTQDIVVESTGDPGALSGGEVPSSADLSIAATGRLTYQFAEGPDEGTFQVSIDGTFSDVEVTGTVDGEPAEQGDIAELGSLEPVSTTVVVDSSGRVLGEEGAELDPLGMGADPLAQVTGGQLGRLVGPPLPAEEVAVGEPWSEEIEEPGLGTDPAASTITSTVTGTEEVGGAETFVIASESASEGSELDLGEFMAGFLGAFADPDNPDEELAEALEGLRFIITVQPNTSTSTTWFAPGLGAAVRSVVDGPAAVMIDVAIPDEQTGEVAASTVDVDFDQHLEYRLVEGGPAATTTIGDQ